MSKPPPLLMKPTLLQQPPYSLWWPVVYKLEVAARICSTKPVANTSGDAVWSVYIQLDLNDLFLYMKLEQIHAYHRKQNSQTVIVDFIIFGLNKRGGLLQRSCTCHLAAIELFS